jgi:threonine synthase
LIEVACTNCHRPYPDSGVPYRCPTCTGLFDFVALPAFDPGRVETDQPGIWRYRHAFGLPADAPQIYLGEGATPLVWGKIDAKRVAFKVESSNPTGSFKDRGSAVLASFLVTRAVDQAIEDSSGNAGASFAAYASRAGISCKIFIPESASGPKRTQIETYGAKLMLIPGPRSQASEAVLKAAEHGNVYGSHAFLPFGLLGYATAAYEIVEQLGSAPGTVIVPVGHGNFLLGLIRGFKALSKAGVIDHLPRLVGVQAEACAPLWALFAYGPKGLDSVIEGTTLAEGIRVLHPARSLAVIQAVLDCEGIFVTVKEDAILAARDELARQGLYVEPTSAVVLPAFRELAGTTSEPIVSILTGSGLKYREIL